MAKKHFWQKGWFPGLFISLLLLSLGWTSTLTTLEWQVYGFGARLSPSPETKSNLEIIAIDEVSLQQLGEWPWPRSYLATLLKKLNASQARTIGIELPLHTAQSEFGVRRLDTIRDAYEGKYEKTVKDMLFLARQRLDTDGALANSLKQTDNAVLSLPYGLISERRKDSASALGQELQPFALRDFKSVSSLWSHLIPSVLTGGIAEVTQAQAPIPMLAKQAAAGMLDASARIHRSRLVSPLLFKYADRYYPSFSLVFAARSLGIDLNQIDIEAGQDIRLGDRLLDTDPAYRVYPRLYRSSSQSPVFAVHSFADVYSNRKAAADFNGKDVLIGITAPSLVDEVTIPGGDHMVPVKLNAHLINNLRYGDMFKVPEWALKAQMAALLIVALYLTLLLPRLRLWVGLVTSLLLLFIIVNIQIGLMVISALWIPLVLPTITLLIGVAAVALRGKIDEAYQRAEAHLFESNLTIGQHLQSQGQLDLAFEKYRVCAFNDTLLDRLYNLGLDYERRRQFSKAVMVFEHISKPFPDYRDVRERMLKNQEIQQMVILPGNGGTSAQQSLIVTDGVQKPMLGRYEIEKEIGRGAMGMVYLGRDPKIGRTVAIKTMALAQEFEAEDLEQIKQRFMREAETAGRLNHQNIVTIYDVGEEQELSYIAMDYLTGKDLSHYRKTNKLLAIEKVIDIGIQVALALDFAHKHHVVHRDIKPANIIYDEDHGSVKVTDFGVACLINSSKTKTGTMLGTPYYMSPEQASGDKVDGRSDLYSLGTTLYQLSTGQMPFVSDSLSGLIYKICHVKHEDASKVRESVPPCLSRVITKALSKDRDDRYKNGAQMAKALRMCRNSL